MTARTLLGLIALTTLASPAHPDQQLRLFDADDVFELEYANDPRISPDGTRIVYERRAGDIMSDRFNASLWMVDVDGRRHRPLVAGPVPATSPRWSPQGDRIAYLQSGENGARDVMVLWLDTGQRGRIARLRETPRHLSWSPDGKHLAFTMQVKAETTPLVKPRKGPEGSTWSDPVRVFDAVRYKRDGKGFVETAHTHIFLLPADGGTPRQVTSGEFNHEGPLSWSPDGRKLYFSANRTANWEYEPVETDLYAIEVDSAALTAVTSRPGAELSPRVSPDGTRIAFLADDGRKVPYRNRVIRVIGTQGGDETPLTAELDRSAASLQWSADSRHVYFHYDDHGTRKVARVDLGGHVEPVVDGLGGGSVGRPYVSGSFTVAGGQDGAPATVAFMHGRADRLADVAVANGGGTRQLTQLNEDLLGQRDLGALHEIRYASSFDGTEIQAWYLTPPGYEPGKAYPTILEIHGGPHLAYGPQFAAELQRYAAAGYAVFYDNHRGSTGYGEDFALLLDGKYSSKEDFADHMSGVDALVEAGIADPDQLYITGGSAGGIATAYAIGLTDRFRAAAVQKPVINWISKVLTADSYLYQIPYQFPGMPWDELEHYWQRSPLSLVGNVTCSPAWSLPWR
jgi:dipeptidyl aminopeptidase/acylaminoacyl peptidase